MANWEDLKYFIAIANAQSISGAARQLRVDHATVSRHLNSLETSLKNKLIDRNARRCQLTEFGTKILSMARHMENISHSIERVSVSEQKPISGKVSLSVPPVLATHFITRCLKEFNNLYPHIQLSISSQVTSISLSRREADIAIRFKRPTSNTDVSRKVMTVPFGLYAHKNYRYINQPDLWEFIGYDHQFDDMPHAKWINTFAGNRQFCCLFSDITSQFQAVTQNIGVACIPDFLGNSEPLLKKLPLNASIYEPEVWIIVHQDLRNNSLIRSVFDFMVEALKTNLYIENHSLNGL